MVFQTEGSQLTSWMIFCSSLFSLSSCLDFSSSLLLVDEPVFMVSWASDCHSPRVIRRRIYETCTCSFYYKKVRFWAASVIQGLLAEWEQSRAARPVLPESYIQLSNVGVIFWYPRSFWQHNVWQKTLPGDRGQQTCWRLWADIDADTAGQGQFTGHCGTCHTSPGDSPDERQFIIPDAYTAAVICREEDSPPLYLGDKQDHKGDVDREDDGQGGEGKGGVLLRGQDHGHWSCDHTQHLGKQWKGCKEVESQKCSF